MSKSKCDRYAVWPTAWGAMGAVAGPGGLMRTILPHYQPDDLRALLAFEHPGATEDREAFADLVGLSQAYFNGEPVDFAEIDCDLPSQKSWAGRVLRTLRGIGYGRSISYSELSRLAGNPEGARATAAAVGKNPLPLVIPCHRVIYNDGRIGGFSAPAGPEQKRRMLQLEGASG
jgi:methylated-DNA-[protein]-cysteine S-methyltransferase